MTPRTGEVTSSRVRVLGVDAGGTMTDTIFIDESGRFVIGKAQSTPENESLGFAESSADALRYWGLTTDQAFEQIVTGVFSGTSMLNRLLERKGQRVGLIVTRGMEDSLRLERGVQTWLGASYADMFHAVTRTHHEPLVPSSRVRGVGGRIDSRGVEAIPLYEDDARAAIRHLLAEKVDCICVNLLFSWRNPAHERRVMELADHAMSEIGNSVPVYLSSEHCPKRLDFSRMNTLVIEAYAVEPGRRQLQHVRAKARELGGAFDLRVMAGFGGTISIDSTQLVNTLVSGPIGGCVGARYLTEVMGTQNIACADIGGTSFDVALITNGRYEIKSNPDIAHFKMNFPMVRIDSIGAGCGSFVRVNPVSTRIEFGPDSAGAAIGVSNPSAGVKTVTISDCDVVLGLINPDYFLGGQVVLERERALSAVREQIAEPLGLDPVEAAAGVIELFEDELRRQMRALVMGKGFEPADFQLLGYGGGGPLHVASFAEGLHFEDVLVPSWAAAFSAFGCVCADFAYRVDRQVDLEIPPGSSAEHSIAVALAIDAAWKELRKRVAAEFQKSGVDAGAITFKTAVRMQYLGQLNDIEISSPLDELTSADDLMRLVEEYERAYGDVYAASARSPELGYFVTLAIVVGSAIAEKPALPEEPAGGKTPPPAARKQSRKVYSGGAWVDAQIFEMEHLKPGNSIQGVAIIEAPSTTLVVPDGHVATMDKHRIFHLSAPRRLL